MASNVFDTAAALAFNSVSALMGYDATWVPSNGGSEIAARVLFRAPTAKELAYGRDFDETQYQMEFKEGDFPGLETLVQSNYSDHEVVTIDNVQYMVRDVTRKWDGRTYKARLEPVRQ